MGKEKIMRIDFVKRTMGIAMALMLAGFAPLGAAQDKPAMRAARLVMCVHSRS